MQDAHIWLLFLTILSENDQMTSEWQYIVLFVVSGSIKKPFSIDYANNSLFFTCFEWILPSGKVWDHPKLLILGFSNFNALLIWIQIGWFKCRSINIYNLQYILVFWRLKFSWSLVYQEYLIIAFDQLIFKWKRIYVCDKYLNF